MSASAAGVSAPDRCNPQNAPGETGFDARGTWLFTPAVLTHSDRTSGSGTEPNEGGGFDGQRDPQKRCLLAVTRSEAASRVPEGQSL